MTKTILTALAVLFALGTPAFAAIGGDAKGAVYQEEPATNPEQPQPEGEGEGGGGGGD